MRGAGVSCNRFSLRPDLVGAVVTLPKVQCFKAFKGPPQTVDGVVKA